MANPQSQQPQRSTAANSADKKDLVGQSSYSANRPNTEKKLNTSDDLDEDEEDGEI